MKTNYLQKNRSRNSNRRSIGLILLVVLAGIIVFSFIGGIFISAATPVWKAENIIVRSFVTAGSYFKEKKDLINENARLKLELQSYESLVSSARAIKERHDMLLRAYGRDVISEGVASSVLVRPPLTPYDTLIIDAGRKDEVLAESVVTSPDGVILGVVADVYAQSSKVKLISSDGEKTNAVLERGELPVILIGQGGGNFKLVLPRDVEVQAGDRIISPAISSELIAVVGDINLRPTDSFKEVFARSPINMNSLRFVLIRR